MQDDVSTGLTKGAAVFNIGLKNGGVFKPKKLDFLFFGKEVPQFNKPKICEVSTIRTPCYI